MVKNMMGLAPGVITTSLASTGKPEAPTGELSHRFAKLDQASGRAIVGPTVAQRLGGGIDDVGSAWQSPAHRSPDG